MAYAIFTIGVAPGKWLGKLYLISLDTHIYGLRIGYGATTLPALTEAFTIDNNATQAKYEVGRLNDLILSLAETIRP